MGRKLGVQSAVLGAFIGLACLALLLRQVDLKQSWSTLGRLNEPYILIPLTVLVVNLPMRAWRWQLIFPSSKRPGLWTCLSVLGIANMANFLLPGRAGDVARCVLVGRAGSLTDGSRTLATLAVEKVLDGLALLAMLLFSAWVLRPPQWVLDLIRVAIVVFGGALVLLVFLRYRTHALIGYVRRGSRRLHLYSVEERLDGLLASFADGLGAVSSAGQMLILLLITAAVWTTEALSIWGLALALGLAVPLKSAVVASAVLGLGLMIPAAPGGLGTYELFGTEAFKLTGIAASGALALTVVIHAWTFLVNTGIGVCLVGAKGISFARLLAQLKDDSAVRATSSNPTDADLIESGIQKS